MSTTRLIDLFLSLVKYPSPSGLEGGIGNLLHAKLCELGFEVAVDDADKKINGEMGNIIARKKSHISMKPILLCAHMDTVKPISKTDPIIKDGIIKSCGDGVIGADDKAGIAAILEGVQRIIESSQEHIPIEILFTVCEEGGLKGSYAFDVKGLRSCMGFVFDSRGSVGNIIIQAPAKKSLEFTFKGRAAHAGAEPEKGINAIVAASKAIVDMELGRISDITTANIGIIQGGVAKNIVPETVKITGEVRSLLDGDLNEQVARMVKVAQKAAEDVGATLEKNVIDDFPNLKLNKSDHVVQVATEAIMKLGIKVEYCKSGGGSDAAILTKKGIPSVNLAVGYEHPHTNQEEIAIEQLEKASELVVKLLTTFEKSYS
ncbi:MAG: M20/M25/M40 family metallo-hydrolase [Peptococcaceae bacterium]